MVPPATWRATVTPTPKTEGQWYQIAENKMAYRGAEWDLSTNYKFEIPTSTESYLGSTLEKAHTFDIYTKTPKLTSFFPPMNEPGLPSNVTMVLCFDQKVNVSKFTQKIKVSDGGLFTKAGGVEMLSLESELTIPSKAITDFIQVCFVIS